MYELSLDALGSWASLPDIVSAAVIRLARRPGEPQCDRPLAPPPLVCFPSQSLANSPPLPPVPPLRRLQPPGGDNAGEGRRLLRRVC